MAIKVQGVEIIGDVTAYISLSGTSAVRLPTGTTAQRPSAPNLIQGQLRYNSELVQFEGYDGIQWGPIGGADEISKTLALLAA